MSDEPTDGKPLAGNFAGLEAMRETQVSPATGVAAIALNMAMKYHDINMVKDGVLYQQYKLEGKNLQPLHLDHVFETAIKIERHLATAPGRIYDMMLESLEAVAAENEEQESADSSAPSVPEGGDQ